VPPQASSPQSKPMLPSRLANQEILAASGTNPPIMVARVARANPFSQIWLDKIIRKMIFPTIMSTSSKDSWNKTRIKYRYLKIKSNS